MKHALQDFLRVYSSSAYEIRPTSAECSPGRPFVYDNSLRMHVHKWGLCTAKESIHPQCPQAYPHIQRGKVLDFPDFHQGYPQYPQLIHKLYPLCKRMWICMWKAEIGQESMFTHVTNANKYACSCMFAEGALRLSAHWWPDITTRGRWVCNKNVISPKKSRQAPTQ